MAIIDAPLPKERRKGNKGEKTEIDVKTENWIKMDGNAKEERNT